MRALISAGAISALLAVAGAAEPGTDAGVPSFSWAAKLFPLPGTKRIYLHQPCDYRIVQARPDLKFQMKPATGGGPITGLGFVILKEGQPESFDLPRTIYVGPQGLLGAGVLAADSPLVPAIEASLRKAGCLSDLFAFHMKTMEDATLKALQERSGDGQEARRIVEIAGQNKKSVAHAIP